MSLAEVLFAASEMAPSRQIRAHQRKKVRRRVSTAVMAGFTTSMLSTIIISLVMVWLLTDGRQASATGQNGYAQSKEAVSVPQEGTLSRR